MLQWEGIHVVLASTGIYFCLNLVILSENHRDMFQLFWGDETHWVTNGLNNQVTPHIELCHSK